MPENRKRVTVFLMILAAVCLEATGQTLYKAGINREAVVHGSLWHLPNLFSFVWQTVTNWRVLSGLAVYVAEVLLWWVILSRSDISYAFPLMSMSYVLLLISARVFLHEQVSLERWIGACTIMVGVYLITRTAPLHH